MNLFKKSKETYLSGGENLPQACFLSWHLTRVDVVGKEVDNELGTVEDGLVEMAAAVGTGEYMVEVACCGVHIDWPTVYHCFPKNVEVAARFGL